MKLNDFGQALLLPTPIGTTSENLVLVRLAYWPYNGLWLLSFGVEWDLQTMS
jgi:hypothetical protein